MTTFAELPPMDPQESQDPYAPQDLEREPKRVPRVTWANQIEPEPVTWAWKYQEEARIPAGSLSIAAGREGTGKSSFGIWLAAKITTGTLPGSMHGTPKNVLYVAVEDSWKYTLVPRLMAANADRSMVGRFEVFSDVGEHLTLSLPSDLGLLERTINQHDVGLVVVDPLMSVIGEKIDTHRERDVRTALDPLARMADRTGAVILGIAHFNKGNGSDAASLITGSGAFKNVPRSVFGFARDEGDERGGRILSQVKNSLGRDDLPSLGYLIETAEIQTAKGIATTGKFTLTGISDKSVADVLRDAGRDPESVADDQDAASWIRDYLQAAGGSAPASEVLEAANSDGLNAKTVKNARNKVATTTRSGFGKDAINTWALKSIGHAIGPIGPTDQKPGPTGPMTGPMKETDTPRGDTPARLFEPPTGPGRCASCSWHIEKQGHSPECGATR